MDGKDVPMARPMVNGEEKEKSEVASEQGENDIPWEEIYIPTNTKPKKTKEGKDPWKEKVYVHPICPLCNNTMKFKGARGGGWFYGCEGYPKCKGYRGPTDKRPGPVALVEKERNHYGSIVWEEMEKKKKMGQPFI